MASGLLGGMGSLGGTLGQVLVRVGIDTKQLEAGMAKAKGEAEAGATKFQKFGQYTQAAFLVAGAAAIKFGITAVAAASAEAESINKVGEVFGAASGKAEEFASSAAESLGIAKTAALDASANFGLLFEAAGKSADAAEVMSERMVTLSADLASFFNDDPEQALEKLRAGFAGAVRPLREYGIFISAARVKTEAYASGIAAVGAELNDAQKIQARYNIILQDTGIAQGDFARTSDGLANQQRILKAEWENITATLGSALLPAVTEVTHELVAMAQVVQALAHSELPAFHINLGLLGNALKLIHNPFGDFILGLKEAIGLTRVVAVESATYTGTLADLKGAIADSATVTGELAAAQEDAAKAAREQKQAMQALAGGAVGLLASLDQLKAAQIKLNSTRKDATATAEELRSAEINVLQAQLGVTGSFKDLVAKQIEAGVSSGEVVQKFQELANKAGLSKREIGELTGFIQDYIDKLKDIPTSLTTTLNLISAGTPVGGPGPHIPVPSGQGTPGPGSHQQGVTVNNNFNGTVIGNSDEFRAAVSNAVYQAQRRRRSA